MNKKNMRLSRPVYEGLPWFYLFCGLAGLLVSYVERGKAWSMIPGIAGLSLVIGGIVVLLRRRDFRDLRERYGDEGRLG